VRGKSPHEDLATQFKGVADGHTCSSRDISGVVLAFTQDRTFHVQHHGFARD
jgi:hypothetical protein